MASPQLLSITINDGQVPNVQFPMIAGVPGQLVPVPVAGQQSIVHNLKLKFDIPVTLDPDAVSIAPHAGVLVKGPAQPNQLAVVVEVDAIPGGGDNLWVATFDGPGTDPVSGILLPGVYDVTIDPTKVKYNGTPMDAAPAPFTFWTMFGGALLGVGTIVSFGIANTASMDGKFGAKAGDANYSPAYDADLTGTVDGIDRTKAEAGAGTTWVF